MNWILEKKGVDTMNKTALFLVIVGALNWLLVGLFQFDLVATIFGGQQSLFSRIVYLLVGISGLWCIKMLFSTREMNTSTRLSQPAMKPMDDDKNKQ
jgi:uncharacterized membrane protein YuzA (DUF378 family)